MEPSDIEEQVRRFASNLYPEVSVALVRHMSGPSLAYVRAERRRRGPGTLTDELVKSAPIEHQFIYVSTVEVAPDVSLERVVIVTTDVDGNIKRIVESK